MISPRSMELLIKHLDAVDVAVSRRLSRRRPWPETALTVLLCDLLDSETQDEIPLLYTLTDLNRDLVALDGVLTFTIEIETIEYPSAFERWVNQSDLGLYIQYRDHFIPKNSWDAAYLCQAKRLYPSIAKTGAFDESSRFRSFSAVQHKRIEKLHEILEEQLVYYLLYCPRPSDIDELTRRKLAHLRNQTLASDIFDFSLGLFLREELSRPNSSIAAGIFLSSIDNMPKNLAQVHRDILRGTTPFSWFLASLFQRQRDFIRSRSRGGTSDLAKRIVRGEPRAIAHVVNAIADADAPASLPGILPGHVVKIGITAGGAGDADRQVIREQ